MNTIIAYKELATAIRLNHFRGRVKPDKKSPGPPNQVVGGPGLFYRIAAMLAFSELEAARIAAGIAARIAIMEVMAVVVMEEVTMVVVFSTATNI
ncbi:hypothetical protein KDW_35600 [Dictyobacter vulcani]|uniref:Uncharacterized protein n=1 Tax=Dictyobacter vulcani TaxID=2607529 RepID=A0A5J4KHY2_9CHLR|nr:hypothetical protein KDW_35600 [Dictyobacter vulcani]